MEFSYIGEKPLVILYGDFQRMRDYCDDLMRFGIEPQMIIADEEATADEKSWWGIPVNTVEALTQYKNEQFLSIVPIGRWLEGTKNKIREIDEQLSHYVIRDIELLMRLCMKSVIKDIRPVNIQPSDEIFLSLQLGFVLGGIEAYTANLYHALKNENMPVRILEPIQTSRYEYVGADFFHVPQNDVITVGPYGAFMPYVEKIVTLLSVWQPRVYIDNGSYRCLAAVYIAKKQLRIPIQVISVLHGDVNIVYKRILLCRNIIDRIVAVSDGIKEHMANLLPDRVCDITVHIQLPSAHPESLQNRKQTNRLQIAYAARLEPSNKRSLWLIDVIDKLVNMDVPFDMHIAGEGECFGEINEYIKKNNLGYCVHMYGAIPRV